jgi:hypothetical protein
MYTQEAAGAFIDGTLEWPSQLCVCVCVCARARARACVQEAAGAFSEGEAGRAISSMFHILQPAVVDAKRDQNCLGVCVCLCVSVSVSLSVSVSVSMCVYVHMYICMCMCMCVCVCVCVCVLLHVMHAAVVDA